MQRLVYKPLKYALDALLRGLAQMLPALRAEKTYAVALPALGYVYDLLLNFARFPATLQANYKRIFSPKASAVFVVKNANVSWRGVVFKNLRVFSPTLHPGTEPDYQNSSLLKQWLSKSVALPVGKPRIALVYNQLSAVNYYHWIIETIPRLLALRTHSPGCLLLLPEPAPEYMQTTAAIFGFDKLFRLSEGETLKAAKLLVPYATLSHWGLPYGYTENNNRKFSLYII